MAPLVVDYLYGDWHTVLNFSTYILYPTIYEQTIIPIKAPIFLIRV